MFDQIVLTSLADLTFSGSTEPPTLALALACLAGYSMWRRKRA